MYNIYLFICYLKTGMMPSSTYNLTKNTYYFIERLNLICLTTKNKMNMYKKYKYVGR